MAETRTSDHRGSEFQVIIYTFLGANACKFITVIKSGKKQHLTWPQWIYCDIAILQVQREQQHGVFTCLEISCSAPLCPLIFSGETSFWLWPCFVFIFFSLSLFALFWVLYFAAVWAQLASTSTSNHCCRWLRWLLLKLHTAWVSLKLTKVHISCFSGFLYGQLVWLTNSPALHF